MNRFFGITKINHDGYGWTGDGGRGGYKNGEYIDYHYGVGGTGADWVQVSSLTDNGDATFTAVVDSYWVNDWIYMPDNWYEPSTDWKLDPGTQVVDGNKSWEDGKFNRYIRRVSTTAITIIPYMHNNESTWQITAINGRKIPRELFTTTNNK